MNIKNNFNLTSLDDQNSSHQVNQEKTLKMNTLKNFTSNQALFLSLSLHVTDQLTHQKTYLSTDKAHLFVSLCP